MVVKRNCIPAKAGAQAPLLPEPQRLQIIWAGASASAGERQ